MRIPGNPGGPGACGTEELDHLRAERMIDFEALDGQPVELIFLLLAPEAAGADHLKALARVARLLRDPEVARKLRESRDADAVYAVLAMPAASSAA